MYTYKDFVTGKPKRTRGRFAGWTQPTGLLQVRYAIFRNRYSDILVPEYCLTPETRLAVEAITAAEKLLAADNGELGR